LFTSAILLVSSFVYLAAGNVIFLMALCDSHCFQY